MRPASAIIYQYLCVSPEYLLLQQSLVKALFGLRLQMMRNAKERAGCASSLNTPISYEYIRQLQGGSNIGVFPKFETLRSLKCILFLSFTSHVIPCYLHLSTIFHLISCLHLIPAFTTKLTFVPTFPAEKRVVSINIATSAGENKPNRSFETK